MPGEWKIVIVDRCCVCVAIEKAIPQDKSMSCGISFFVGRYGLISTLVKMV